MADIFDRDGDGYIDYYEFVAALHPNKDAYKPLTDADKIEDEVRAKLRRRQSSRSETAGTIRSRLPAGDAPSGQMQMSQKVPSGTDWRQQIPGEQRLFKFKETRMWIVGV